MVKKQQEQMGSSVASGKSFLPSTKTVVYFVFSCVATLGIFYYLLSKVSIGEVLQLVREISYPALIAFVFLSFSTSFFRAWRYLIVLQVAGVRPKLIPLFLVVIIRNFFSDLLPARIGTMVYIFLANTRLGVDWAAATSSFALAFLFDMLALVPLVVLAAFVAASVGSIPFWPLLLGALILGLVVVPFLLFLPHLCSWFGKRLQRYHVGLGDLLLDTQKDLDQVKKQGLYLRLLLLSVMVRIGKYSTYLVLLYALLKSLGLYLEDLHVAEAFLGLIASEISASTPISGIGGFGLYEGTWVVVFRLLGLPERASELTAISHHLFTQVYGYGIGAVALVVLLLPIFKVTKEQVTVKPGKSSAKDFYRNLVFSTVLIVLLAAAILKAPVATSQQQQQSGADQPSGQESVALAQLSNVFPGRVVFDSNRSGTFGIYAIATDGGNLEKLSDSEQEEMYPDVAPDGKRVVFGRARSTARMALSDIWILDLASSQERLLAENGTYPTFSGDGRTVFFERIRRRVIALDLQTNQEQEVFPSDNRDFRRFQVVKPRISPDGRYVAFTSNNPSEWHAWFADLESKEAFLIAPGCEPTWFPDSARIAFIKMKGARDGSGIFSYDLKTKEVTELIDFGPPRGHEYFPTVHPNGSLILYASSREGEHSHLTANYQLFAYDLKSEKRTRLTFDPYTNRWPKFLP